MLTFINIGNDTYETEDGRFIISRSNVNGFIVVRDRAAVITAKARVRSVEDGIKWAEARAAA